MLRRYRDLAADAPDELTTILNLRQAPPLAIVPEDLHGCPVLTLAACYCGPVERGEEVLRAAAGARPAAGRRDRAAAVHRVAAPVRPSVPHGWHYHWRTCELPPLTDHAIDALCEQAARITSPRSYIIVFQLGGAVARPAEDTAYAQRDAAHNVNINAVLAPRRPRGRPPRSLDARDAAALEPSARSRAYVNFLADEPQERVKAAYGPAAYERLVALKRRYDPENVLRLNQNIAPE